MGKRKLSITLGVLFVLIITGACSQTASETETISLKFHAVVDQAPLVFNQIQYANPGGEGLFKVRDFLFLISNVKLTSESGTYLEPQSYHLARFDNKDKTYTITLNNVLKQNYQTIEFSIGVDKSTNTSLMSIGDLDPNSRMAWSWDVGYKFILFEGGLALEDVLYPLVYHVGFDENYKPMVFKLQPSKHQNGRTLEFQVDIMKLFNGRKVIDMTRLSSVKFDRQDAKLIAENFQTMIILCSAAGC